MLNYVYIIYIYLVCMWWVSPVLSTEYTPESGLNTDTL